VSVQDCASRTGIAVSSPLAAKEIGEKNAPVAINSRRNRALQAYNAFRF